MAPRKPSPAELARRQLAARAAFPRAPVYAEPEPPLPQLERPLQPKHGAGIAPWHMWGNTQTMTAANSPATQAAQATTSQLVRIGYKRPETWHWLFAAKLLSGPDMGAGNHASVQVFFDLTVGIGRSMIRIPGFESFVFRWDGPAPGGTFPQDRQLYSTSCIGPNRIFVNPPGVPTPSEIVSSTIDEIVAQDLQLSCRLFFDITGGGSTPVVVEVQAQFSPKTHLRPEWHMHLFPGAEEQ
jgi:hypothetical protein